MANLKSILIVVALIAVPRLGLAAAPPITIHVLNGPDNKGFIEPKVVDSTKDIERALSGCSTLRIVKAATITTRREDMPKLLISVVRSVEKTDGLNPTYFEALRATVSVVPTFRMTADWKAVPPEDPYFKFIYKVGGGGAWRYAARQVVDDLCDWVKANQGRLAADGEPQGLR